MLAAPGTILCHYRLVEKIGEGGMGVVWRAADMRLDRDVAIKLLPDTVRDDPRRLAQFEAEAKTVARLNHPNIVTIYSVEECEGGRFITMELVRGRPLDTVIPGEGLPLDRLLDLAVPIADALSAAHEHGITHGDIKPANVMVSDEGRVKILDFGLARFRQPAATSDSGELRTRTLNHTDHISGTLPYMSPEHVQGRPLDGRSDIFSMGIILYEMATGRRPFDGESPADLIAAILKDTPASISPAHAALPRRLERIIRKCLEKDPAQRPETMGLLRGELERARTDTGREEAQTVASIAVLPFADMSRKKDQDYFCEGVAEEIINALTKVRDLHVVSRTSAFQFKEAAMDVREIGRRLNVDSLLEGSVRKAGERLRVTAQLINVADGYHIWSERFDREIKDIFVIQDEIARSIVAALQVTLSPKEHTALQKLPTTDVHAYDCYLRGRKFYYQYGRYGVESALLMFRKAIERDPGYALAHAGIADCYSYRYMNVERSETNRSRADAASRRALELDPDLAEAHASRGVALSLNNRDDEAEKAFLTAIQLNPRLFEGHYFYARHCFARGQFQKAIQFYTQASEVAPEDFQSPLLVAQIYDAMGDASLAAESRRKGVRIAEERIKLDPGDVRALYLAANGLVALGEREQGLELARRARSLEPEEPMLLYNLACIAALAGETEEALECLERAIGNGFTFIEWMEKDVDLTPIRSHPRYRALMQKID